MSPVTPAFVPSTAVETPVMTTSVLSSALLEKFDPTAFTQRLYQRETAAPASATSSASGNVLANVDRNSDTSAQQNFFADLNAARTQQYGATYSATGSSSRTTTNAILVGYG